MRLSLLLVAIYENKIVFLLYSSIKFKKSAQHLAQIYRLVVCVSGKIEN